MHYWSVFLEGMGKKGTEEVLRACDMINDNVAKCLKEEIVEKITIKEKD